MYLKTQGSFKFLPGLMLLFFTIAGVQAQPPTGAFHEVVYENVKITSDIAYGENHNYFFNDDEVLELDIYEPDATINYKRPLLIYVHGGGFTGGDKTTDKAPAFGNYFAQRGYVVASINYRLSKEVPDHTEDNYQAVYFSAQDARCAIRFFKKYAEDYCLDTSAFFMTGTSAGGVITLLSAYWDQYEVDPAIIAPEFGNLDNGGGNAGYSNQLNSIVVCWGGITDTTWLKDETEPNQLFHGTDDQTVPYTQGYDPDGVYLYGGYVIHRASEEYGVESYLKPYYDTGHGFAAESPKFDTLLTISNDFLFSHLPDLVGLDEVCGYLDLAISPNPSNGWILIENISSSISYLGSFSLFDLSGKMVDSRNISITPRTTTSLNYTFLQTGLYIFQFHNGESTITKKMLIVR